MNNTDIAKYVNQAQNGSRKAFDKIVKLYMEPIYHLFLDMTKNQEDANDLVQETFLRAYLSLKQFQGNARFSTWLYRIAYNIGIDFKRRSKRKRTVDIESESNKNIIDKEKYITIRNSEYIGFNESLEKAFTKLSQPQKMAVIFHHYHGLKMKEIGEILGCTEGTARSHLFRAMGKLRNELKDYDLKE